MAQIQIEPHPPVIPKAKPQGNRFYDSVLKVRNKLGEYSKASVQEIEKQIFDRQPADNVQPDYVFTILYLVGLFLFALIIVMIQSFFVMILWNYTIPHLFGQQDSNKDENKVKKLNWLSALSLLVLIRILFF